MTNRERGFWRVRAVRAVEKVVQNFFREKEICIFSPLQPSEKEELSRRIDEAYPFGIRANHPYKVWLSVRAEYRQKINIETPKPSDRKHSGEMTQHNHNQLNLF